MSFYTVQLHQGPKFEVELMPEGHVWEAKVEGQSYQLRLVGTCPKRGLAIEIDNQRIYLPWNPKNQSSFHHAIETVSVSLPSKEATPRSAKGLSQEEVPSLSIPSPIAGILVDVLVNAGEELSEGDPILIIEAMKMENTIYAPSAGRVEFFPQEIGTEVKRGMTLAVFRPEENSNLSSPSLSGLQAFPSNSVEQTSSI